MFKKQVNEHNNIIVQLNNRLKQEQEQLIAKQGIIQYIVTKQKEENQSKKVLPVKEEPKPKEEHGNNKDITKHDSKPTPTGIAK